MRSQSDQQRGTTQNAATIEFLAKLVKDIDYAMLVTIDQDGHLRSRPMMAKPPAADGTLWFFTNIASGKVSDLDANPQVNVSYALPEEQRYVSISGTARMVLERERIEELWTPIQRMWFPGGIDDPNVALLVVTPEHVEYWDAPSSRMVQAIRFAKAILTGKPSEADHGTVELPESERHR